MKRTAVLAVASGIGFALSFAAVRLLAPTMEQNAGPNDRAAIIAPATSPGPAMISLPGLEDVKTMSANSWLTLEKDMQRLTAEQRTSFLTQADTRPEPQRSALLSLLLLQWAQTDPAAASDWSLSHAECEQAFCDIVNQWAKTDGAALAKWFNSLGGRDENRAAHKYSVILEALRNNCLPAYAELLAMPVSAGTVVMGEKLEQRLTTPQEIAAAASALNGNVRYAFEAGELASHMNSSERAGTAGTGWAELFEGTVRAWHKLDPAACAAWVATFPENAQDAARHVIAESTAHPAPEKPAPPPAFDRTNPAAPPGVFAEAYRQWADWWRAEPQAAEAFLNAAAWPEDLKFRARAKAYASSP